MNTSVNGLILSEFNSFGAEIGKVFVHSELAKKLKWHQDFCRQAKTELYVSDNKTQLQFVVNKNEIRLLIKHIEFQGPVLPKVAKPVEQTPYIPKEPEIYTNSKWKGD